MKSHYKKLTFALVTVFVSLSLLLPSGAHANIIADAALVLPGYIVSWIVLPVMSLLVYLSGMLLNLSINISVVDMAKSVDAAGINEIWKVIRDVANMGFIFVLIYTAIMTIFGKGDYQKVIKNVVIAALLINFSLFITKAIIDASNLVALFFYHAISPGGISSVKGISSSFMDVLGITNLYKGAGNFEGTKLVIIGLGGAVVYLITSFSFLAVAALFIIRFIILMLLMVLSPLMFIGSIIPGVKDKTKEWWDALVSQSLFGPVYFMLTWVTLRITQQMFTIGGGDFGSTGTTTASIASALTGLESGGTYTANSSSAEVLLKFIIVIAFMIASLLAAKKIAEKTGGVATKTAFAWAGGATLGLAGRAGRTTLGRYGAGVADDDNLKKRAAKGGIGGYSARLQLAAGKKMAGASFDVRAIGATKDLGAGKAQKGGFTQDFKDKVKKEKEFADSLKPSDITVARAEKRLDEAKKSDINSADFQRELASERVGRQQRVDKLTMDIAAATRAGMPAEVISSYNDKLRQAIEERDHTLDAAQYKRSKVKAAQTEVDGLKGLSEDDARKRKVRELRLNDPTLSEKAAKDKVKNLEDERNMEIQRLVETGMTEKAAEEDVDRRNIGFKPKAIKGFANERKEEYAKSLSEPNVWHGVPMPDLARVLGVGKVKRENLAAAADIRKSAKEKSKEAKLADSVKALSGDEGGSASPAPTTPPATGGPTPAGGTPPPTTP